MSAATSTTEHTTGAILDPLTAPEELREEEESHTLASPEVIIEQLPVNNALKSQGIEGTKRTVLIAVDGGLSSALTVKAALKTLNKQTDFLVLMHLYSSWDYLNDEKNDGKMAVEHQRAICEQLGFNAIAVQKEAEQSPQFDFCEEARIRQADEFWIGEEAFIAVSNPDNLIYWFFSWIKRRFVGTMAEYIKSYCPCKVIVVPMPQPAPQ